MSVCFEFFLLPIPVIWTERRLCLAKRVVLIVIDGFGIGALPDARKYDDPKDVHSHTLDNTLKAALKAGAGVRLPNLTGMGLGNIEGIETVEAVTAPSASYGRMREASIGKDTSVGHWEIAGRITRKPFATFPDVLPPKLLTRLTSCTSRAILGGCVASGTEIIDDLGEEHLRTGSLILYSSADSVLQIAAHEDVVPLEELYKICIKARSLADGYSIARVIARPFIGSVGQFVRTPNRKDFSVPPPPATLLDILKEYEVGVAGVGKIGDIFAHRGIDFELHTDSDSDGIEKTLKAIEYFEGREALVFTNLIEHDMLYCHRNDPVGAGGALERIDKGLIRIIASLGSDDLLVITADHGNDPTTPSTDHSREYVPLLVSSGATRSGLREGLALGTLDTFADLGATLLAYFGIEEQLDGSLFEY